MKLSMDEQKELSEIMSHPSSFGAFCGMVTNLWATSGKDEDELIQKALMIRVKVRNARKTLSVEGL